MSRKRSNGVVVGRASVKAHLSDAIGGGICKIHGDYYGYGKHNLLDCPFCDIDEFYKTQQNNKRSGE